MQCRKIQELLKSDYLDHEVNRRIAQRIKEHLAKCPECCNLEKELQSQHMLFQKAKGQQVPERVWQNISEAIVTEKLNRESKVSQGILSQLKIFLFPPRQIFALKGILMAIIIVMLIAGVIIQKRQSFNMANGRESIEDYRLNGESEDVLYGLGTNIEEYFL